MIRSQCGQSEENSSEILPITKFLVSGVLTSITLIMGTIGNTLSIITLLHRQGNQNLTQNNPPYSYQGDEERVQLPPCCPLLC